uniref:Odorant-binding protein 14 n=1 Tax=Sitobion avenae TaxID=44664 RepID=A0A1I9ZKL5_9HEMI|nr:odorant-binding protein 14 [Sitobion avenae]
MFTKILLICLLAAISVITVNAEKKYNNQSELIDDMLDNMFTCMHELDVKPDVCGELLLKDKDHSDKKYDNCKCLGPCVAKRMGTMNKDTGKWNWARFKELAELMENNLLRNETNLMQTHCMDEVNTHCTAGYVFMKCVLQNSPMAQDMVKNYLSARENTPDEGGDAK